MSGGRTVGKAVADALVGVGVDVAFGLVGEGNIAVAQPLWDAGHIRWISARREDAVVSMADGYVRRSGADVGFATVTCGPGLTNATTAIVEAAKANTPLVILTGDTPVREQHHPQAIDERAIAVAAHAGVHTVRAPDTAVEDVEIAFQRARQECRPIVLVLPADHADEPYLGAELRTATSRAVPAARSAPEPADVAAVLEMLRQAKRPVILAGRGAVLSEAGEALASLADTLDAPLLTTLRARGLFADHPREKGMVGGFPDGRANDELLAGDLVLAFGTSLGDQTTRSGTLMGHCPVVLFDVQPRPHRTRAHLRRVVEADARAAAQALAGALKQEPLQPAATGRAAAAEEGSEISARPTEPLDAGSLARTIDRLVPASRNVVVDLGYFTSEACRFVRVPEPRRFFYAVNFGSIGLSLATAAGVSVADPHAPTVALVGDGGLMMAIGEIETIARYRLPVVIVVFNDSALGLEVHALNLMGGDPSLVQFPDVDFAKVAEAFGIEAATVRSVADLEALARGRAWDGPLLVNGLIDGTVATPWLDDLVAAGWHARRS